MFTVLFAIPRTAGWIGRWQEMLLVPEQKVAGPRQIYIGSEQRDLVPIERRAEGVLTEAGSVFGGCNVENASFPAGMCAERVAVGALVTRGVRRFELLVIATEADNPTPPCGICRQVLAEFAPALPIISVTRAGDAVRWSLAELLPSPFTPTFLHHT
jgi:cytidine deaminase